MSRAVYLLIPLGLGAAFVALGAALDSAPHVSERTNTTLPHQPAPVSDNLIAAMEFDESTCGGASTSNQTAGDPTLRRAAQRALNFLSQDAVRWQRQHNCYGCHVQAVSVQAASVGMANQYEVDADALAELVRGMTDLPGGSRDKEGLSLHHGSGHLLSGSLGMGGAAFAAYDEAVGVTLRDDLLEAAAALLELQDDHGGIRNDFTNPPIATGALQDTVLAMATWNQAYARSADDRWLAAVADGERWLRGQTDGWLTSPPSDTQQISYALQGFMAAGAGTTEPIVSQLLTALRERQQEDGGWPLANGGGSETLTTGQAVHTLRQLGLTDEDASVRKGTAWLVERQQANGGWSMAGRARAEAMWAVLGLVSVDVVSVAVDGVKDGTRLEGSASLDVRATDNEGGGVSHVQVYVDDIRVGGACGGALSAALDTSTWGDGAHLIDVVATRPDGRATRRRMEVYTGDTWVTRVGSAWQNGQTVFGFRDLDEAEHEVSLEIVRVDDEGNSVETLHREQRTAEGGADRMSWDGKDDRGKAVDGGRYVARLSVLGADGAPRQTVEHAFVHDTPEAQQSNWSQVAGSAAFDDGEMAANAEIELVDKDGRVVARTRSTREGNYQFKNVAEGDFEVRLRKEGFEAAAMPVSTKKGQAASASLVVK